MNHSSVITICGSALLTAGTHFDNSLLIIYGSFMTVAAMIQWYREK